MFRFFYSSVFSGNINDDVIMMMMMVSNYDFLKGVPLREQFN